MACESDKCEEFGMHHEYENGVEIQKCQFCRMKYNQPERAKRSDAEMQSGAPTLAEMQGDTQK